MIARNWPAHELKLALKDGRFEDEGWRIRKDGTRFWANVVITPLYRDGILQGFAKVTRDTTERMQWEEKIQQLNRELCHRVEELDKSKRLIERRTEELQKLSAQLLRVQDEERRRIARELHDELGQELAGLKMLLEADRPGTNIRTEAVELSEHAIQTVRNLSYLLHPPLLDEAGLQAAITWYVDGLTKRSGIEVALEVKPATFQRLSAEIETTVFRIVQESLTNVYRHSGSKKARVEIEQQPESIIVKIQDYGKGISAEIASGKPSNLVGVGISGMRERVKQFGGQLLLSRTEPGTLVQARMPTSNAATDDTSGENSLSA
jgi:signal transduction histidine kinase